MCFTQSFRAVAQCGCSKRKKSTTSPQVETVAVCLLPRSGSTRYIRAVIHYIQCEREPVAHSTQTGAVSLVSRHSRSERSRTPPRAAGRRLSSRPSRAANSQRHARQRATHFLARALPAPDAALIASRARICDLRLSALVRTYSRSRPAAPAACAEGERRHPPRGRGRRAHACFGVKVWVQPHVL